MNPSDRIHPEEDTLLQYVLETLDRSDAIETRTHLDNCSTCRDIEERLRSDVQDLAELPIPVEIPSVPYPARVRKSVPLLQAAALLLIGFALGVFSSRLSQPDRIAWLAAGTEPGLPVITAADQGICESENLRIRID